MIFSNQLLTYLLWYLLDLKNHNSEKDLFTILSNHSRNNNKRNSDNNNNNLSWNVMS